MFIPSHKSLSTIWRNILNLTNVVSTKNGPLWESNPQPHGEWHENLRQTFNSSSLDRDARNFCWFVFLLDLFLIRNQDQASRTHEPQNRSPQRKIRQLSVTPQIWAGINEVRNSQNFYFIHATTETNSNFRSLQFSSKMPTNGQVTNTKHFKIKVVFPTSKVPRSP